MGRLIRTVASLITFCQVPGIGPVYRAGASLLSLSDKASILVLFCKQLPETLVQAQLALAQGSPRHPTPYPRLYSLERPKNCKNWHATFFYTAIQTQTWQPMRNTEHIFLKLMSHSIFLCQEFHFLTCRPPLLVRLNMGRGDRH